MRTFLTGLAIAVSGLAMTACSTFDTPTAAEMGAAVCEPAGPHDATAPGEWICEGEDGSDRVQPRHRVEH